MLTTEEAVRRLRQHVVNWHTGRADEPATVMRSELAAVLGDRDQLDRVAAHTINELGKANDRINTLRRQLAGARNELDDLRGQVRPMHKCSRCGGHDHCPAADEEEAAA